jgi:hypothetical protein
VKIRRDRMKVNTNILNLVFDCTSQFNSLNTSTGNRSKMDICSNMIFFIITSYRHIMYSVLPTYSRNNLCFVRFEVLTGVR